MLEFIFFRGLPLLLFVIFLPEPLSHMFWNPGCFCISDPDFMLLVFLIHFLSEPNVWLLQHSLQSSNSLFLLLSFLSLAVISLFFGIFVWKLKASGSERFFLLHQIQMKKEPSEIAFFLALLCSTERVFFPSYRLPSLFTQRVCSGLAWAHFSMSKSHSTHLAAP